MLAKSRELTTRELSDQLPDIPSPSLYRHMRSMLADGILEISREQQIRGTVERTYKLRINPFDEIAERMHTMDKNELLELFTSFMVAELADFAEYLGDDDYPVEKEHLGFSSNSLYLNESELKNFVKALNSVIKEHSQAEVGRGRRLHKFSFTFIPTRKSKAQKKPAPRKA